MKNRGSSFVIFLSWSDPNNAIFTNATTEKFWSKKNACMIRVATSLSMVVKRLLLLKRDWRVISCLFSRTGFHQNTPGTRKLGPKMRKTINPLFSSSSTLKKEKEVVKFGRRSQRLETQFPSSFFSELSVLTVTNKSLIWLWVTQMILRCQRLSVLRWNRQLDMNLKRDV